MKNIINWKYQIRRINSVLLLLCLFLQIVFIIFLQADIAECEMEEIHQIFGYIFLGLILIHVILHWRKLKLLLTKL